MIPKRTMLCATLALLTTFSLAYAQRDGDSPREGRGPRDGQREGRGPRDGGGPPGRGMGGPPNPLIEAIDKDGDGDVSAEELAGAVAALKTLDENKNGILERSEMRPQFGGFGRGRGPRGEGGGPRPEGDRPRGEGDRPRPEGDRPRGEGDRPRGEGDRPRGEGDRPRPEGDRPPGGRFGGGEGGRGPGGPGGRGFGGPEGMVSRFMEHDADGDGKLSKEELTKAAEAFGSARGRFGGGPGGPRDGGRSGRPARPE